jgi:long-subunit fatty acid transport protein
MKKITILTFIALLSLCLNAQTLLPIKYGIKVGTNIASISATQNDGSSPIEKPGLIGITGGFYMQIPMNNKLSINPELVFTQKGSSFTYDYTYNYPVNQRDEYIATSTLNLSYLELNTTISYKASDKIALNIGPSVSFLIQVDSTFTEKLKNETSPAVSSPPSSIYESESLDIGLNVGINYYFTENLLLEARVNTGFMSIGEITKENSSISVGNNSKSNIYKLKNTGFLFTIAYLF